MAKIIIAKNPFSLGRPEKYRIDKEVSILEIVNTYSILDIPHPIVCTVNGKAVLRENWESTYVKSKDLVIFAALFQAATAVGNGASIATSAIGSDVILGMSSSIPSGNIIVNSLIEPTPAGNLSNQFVSRDQEYKTNFSHQAHNPEPVYNVSPSGSKVEVGDVIPVIYGRHKIFPKFVHKPFVRYTNNEQDMYVYYVLGEGEYEIESVFVNDSLTSSFSDVSYELGTPENMGDLQIFLSDDVVGQELAVETIGPFFSVPAGKTTKKIEIDFVFPRGVFGGNGGTGNLTSKTINWKIEYRLEGAATWSTLATPSISLATDIPQRRTYIYDLATAGRYELQFSRTDTKDTTSSNVGHEIRVEGLKSVLEEAIDYSGLTILFVKMRASFTLSQLKTRTISCIVKRKLNSWSIADGWSIVPTATSSIAWALVDILKADYGAQIEDSRIDLAELARLESIWSARGDEFNGIFDSEHTVWDALKKCAKCGRAAPFMQGGVVRFFRDEQKTIPTAMFSPRNIVKNSFSIEFAMPDEDTADSVQMEYISSSSWKKEEVLETLGAVANKAAKLSLSGCTKEAQASREAKYMAASNLYRRRFVSFQTELEGLIVTYGDLISITHDLPSWGQGAEVISQKGQTILVTEDLVWTLPEQHYVVFRKRDGTTSGPWRVSPGEKTKEFVLQEEIDVALYTGLEEERTHVVFGIEQKWARFAKIFAMKPRGDLVEITAVVENNLVHSADGLVT